MQTVYPAVEERITFVEHDGTESSAPSMVSGTIVFIASVVLPYLFSKPSLIKYSM